MIRSHTIRLYPTEIQENYFKQSCGVARFVYNWGLATWSKQYKRGQRPNMYSVKKLFNQIKREAFPFVINVSKCVPEYALMNLNDAFQKLYKKQAGYPKFKKRKQNVGSFSISNGRSYVRGNMLHFPKITEIKMAECLRFNGKIIKYTVSSKADKWFVSISVEIPDEISKRSETQASIGIDLGIKDTITLSDSRKFNLPDMWKENKRVLRLQRDLSRKQKGSENWKKNLMQLQTAWYKLTCKKQDSIHKITTEIAREFSFIAMENLNVEGMMKNRRLARAIARQSFGEIKRQLAYKADYVFQVDRFFPSSKLCSSCGYKNNELTLADREWVCPQCEAEHDRDVNAAKNILSEAIGKVTSVDSKSSVVMKAINNNKTLVEAETIESVSGAANNSTHINILN